MAEAGAKLIQELMRFKPDSLTANGWAVTAGVSRTIWADLRRHGNPSRRTLEKLLAAAGSSLAEFEALRTEQAAPGPGVAAKGLADSGHGWRAAPLASIPLLEARLAGEWGDAGCGIDLHTINRSKPVGKVDRPAALAADGDAYGVTIAGEAMWPRFRAGRHLLVSPAAPVVVGDDVLVELISGKVLVKELVRQPAGTIELRQFNPDVTFAVDAKRVVAVHKVIGEAI